MMGGFGHALLFLCMLGLVTILTASVATFAASCLSLVVEQTSAGNKDVAWPSETMPDLIARALPILLLLVIWLTPAGILANALREDFPETPTILRFLVLAIPGLWLLFPVGLLSSMISDSPWVVLRLEILRAMTLLFLKTLAFYAATALLALVVGAVWYLTVGGQAALVLLAGPVSAACWLIYARLLGRLAWHVGRVPSRRTKTKPKPARVRTKARDPWAVPEEPQPPPTTPTSSRFDEEDLYNVGPGWQPGESGKPKRPIDEDDDGLYDLGLDWKPADPAKQQQHQAIQKPPSAPGPPASHMVKEGPPAGAKRRKRPRIRKQAPAAGESQPDFTVWTFFWLESTRRVWFYLSLCCLSVGTGVVMLTRLLPG